MSRTKCLLRKRWNVNLKEGNSQYYPKTLKEKIRKDIQCICKRQGRLRDEGGITLQVILHAGRVRGSNKGNQDRMFYIEL